MAEVVTMPVDSLDRRGNRDRKDKSAAADDDPPSSPPPPRRREWDSREQRDDRDPDRPLPRRGGEYYDRNRSPPPRDRDYKRRGSMSPPPVPYLDRRHSPPQRRSPPYKRSSQDDGGGYEGRRGSPRGGFGPPDRRYGYEHAGGHERGMGARLTYPDERRFMGRGDGYQDWDSSRYVSIPSAQREGLMSYKQFIQELKDDILPAEAERRYQEYQSAYISTQKRVFFEAHKDEEWLKDKYHPTNLLTVIEWRNELARRVTKDFLLDLQSGALDLGPAVNSLASSKGQSGNPDSEEDVDAGRKRKLNARKEADLQSSTSKAPPVSSEPRRIHLDVEQAQALLQAKEILRVERKNENYLKHSRGTLKSAYKRRMKRFRYCPKCGKLEHDGGCSKNITKSQHERTVLLREDPIKLEAEKTVRKGSSAWYVIRELCEQLGPRANSSGQNARPRANSSDQNARSCIQPARSSVCLGSQCTIIDERVEILQNELEYFMAHKLVISNGRYRIRYNERRYSINLTNKTRK